MRRILSLVLFTILFAFGSTSGFANAASGYQKPADQAASVETGRGIQGTRQGILNSEIGKLRLVLKISKAADGALKASDAPILMITGDLDPVAPPWLATGAARFLPNSRQISIRNTGHYFRYECLENLLVEFLSRASAKGLDASCVKDIERPPFITRLPPQLAK
jgi:pimeloyl-ACP methyl ester carboxylesterase